MLITTINLKNIFWIVVAHTKYKNIDHKELGVELDLMDKPTACMMIFITNKMGWIIEKITHIHPRDYRVTSSL